MLHVCSSFPFLYLAFIFKFLFFPMLLIQFVATVLNHWRLTSKGTCQSFWNYSTYGVDFGNSELTYFESSLNILVYRPPTDLKKLGRLWVQSSTEPIWLNSSVEAHCKQTMKEFTCWWQSSASMSAPSQSLPPKAGLQKTRHIKLICTLHHQSIPLAPCLT